VFQDIVKVHGFISDSLISDVINVVNIIHSAVLYRFQYLNVNLLGPDKAWCIFSSCTMPVSVWQYIWCWPLLSTCFV